MRSPESLVAASYVATEIRSDFARHTPCIQDLTQSGSQVKILVGLSFLKAPTSSISAFCLLHKHWAIVLGLCYYLSSVRRTETNKPHFAVKTNTVRQAQKK